MSRRTKEQIISERISILKQTSIFSGSEESVLTEIALKLSEKKIEKGKVVFKKGSIGKSMFIIAKGMVRIHDGGHVYARMETANEFGEYATSLLAIKQWNVNTIYTHLARCEPILMFFNK